MTAVDRFTVVEQGRRGTPENLPKTNWTLWDYLWRPGVRLRRFLNLALFRHVLILHGNAVGGGSITHAQAVPVPPDRVRDAGGLKGLDDWRQVLPAPYATARRMLGVTRNRRPGTAIAKLK